MSKYKLPCIWDDFMSDQRVHFTIMSKNEASDEEIEDEGYELENGHWYNIIVDEELITEEIVKKVIAEKLECDVKDIIIIQRNEIHSVSHSEFTEMMLNSQYANSDIFNDDNEIDPKKLLKFITSKLIEESEEYENYEECQRLKDIQDEL